MPSEDILSRQPPAADHRITYGSDPNQFFDLRIPDALGPHPLVFFLHGGYWRAKYDLTHAGHLCHALKIAGIATVNIEYRRVGNPGGGWPGTLHDIRSAYTLLRNREAQRHALDLNRLCVAGHSAGGHLALCLAAYEPSVKHAISLAGGLDLHRAWELHLSNDAVVEFLGGSPAEVPERYREASPAEQRTFAAQKIFHGTADTSVPYEIGKNYAERKTRAGEDVELITLPDVGHFELIDPGSQVWPRVQQTIEAALNS